MHVCLCVGVLLAVVQKLPATALKLTESLHEKGQRITLKDAKGTIVCIALTFGLNVIRLRNTEIIANDLASAVPKVHPIKAKGNKA